MQFLHAQAVVLKALLKYTSLARLLEEFLKKSSCLVEILPYNFESFKLQRTVAFFNQMNTNCCNGSVWIIFKIRT